MNTYAWRVIPVAVLFICATQYSLAQEPGKDAKESTSAEKHEREGFATLNDKRKRLEAEIPQLERELSILGFDSGFLRDYELRHTQYQDDLKRAEVERPIDGRKISFLKTRLINFEREKQIRGLDGEDFKSLDAKIKGKEVTLGSKRQEISAIEATIDRLLNIELAKQAFKTDMSRTFAVLVGFLMAGFFVIAWQDETVRRAVFSGQAGIQLLTLFSLVIAIILFGITGILQDKELSALLGGLSGYILGRVTQSGSSTQNQATLQQSGTTPPPQQGGAATPPPTTPATTASAQSVKPNPVP